MILDAKRPENKSSLVFRPNGSVFNFMMVVRQSARSWVRPKMARTGHRFEGRPSVPASDDQRRGGFERDRVTELAKNPP